VYNKASKFSQFISPLLGGNSKTFLLGTICEDGLWEDHISTLEILKRAKEIYVPILKVSGVPKKELNQIYYSLFAS
jgi:hypothetical protein